MKQSQLPSSAATTLPDTSKTQGSFLAWESAWSSLPSAPGVYWFLDENDKVLYVGKAKNLKKRVAYYTKPEKAPPRTKRLVKTAQRLKHQILESELEALLVEAELIRIHQPHFNILLKDDKTPLYVQITDETFPRVLTVRKKDILTKKLRGTIIGPLPSGYKVKEVLGIVRAIFPWCNQRGNSELTETPCFYHHLQLCSGACVGAVSQEEYSHTISNLVFFLKGKKKTVLKTLQKQMKAAAEQQQYELAANLRDKLAVIAAVTAKTFILKPNLSLPTLQLTKQAEAVTYLRQLLSTYSKLPKQYPLTRIEGYDVSNTQGTNASVAMVVAIEGRPDSSEYRLFNIRTLNTPNDYAMMKEALQRRQNHPEWGRPHLLVIDGGKGQLRAALSVWQWSCPVISIAKDPDRIIIPIFATVTPQDIKKPVDYHILKLDVGDPALKLIQELRDEAHRFSKKQHSSRRLKNMFK